MHAVLQWRDKVVKFHGSLDAFGDAHSLRAMLGFCVNEIEEYEAMDRAMSGCPDHMRHAVLASWPDIGAIRDLRAEIIHWFEGVGVAA